MVQFSSRLVARLAIVALLAVGGALAATRVVSQTLPHLRTTFVARNVLEPSPCFEFACYDRSSYDGNTLAAIGATYPAVYVFLRISAGPWYAQAVLQNRTTLPAGYDTAGYRFPVAVVGDDILVTAFQAGPAVPETCATHVFGRTDTRWQVKQVINICARQFAKDGNRVLFGTDGQMPIYARGGNGLFSEESRVFPPSPGFFSGQASLALHGWTVVVGNPRVNVETGAAYVYQHRGGQWLLVKTLFPEGQGAPSRFGHAVGVYEYNIAVSAPGAVNSSGVGRGLVYMYTGVNDNWFVSQEIAEPPGTDNRFGTALALRGRRLVVSADNPNPFFEGPKGYLFERGIRESAWVARATLAGDGLSIDLSGNTAMIDQQGLRFGTFPTVVNLPALREPEIAP